MTTINQATIYLVKAFEGLRLDAYRDGGGVWTIGYGTTAAAGLGIVPGAGDDVHVAVAHVLGRLAHPSDQHGIEGHRVEMPDRFDREADYAPTDLALGWGRMTEDAVVARLDIRQSGRWYRYRWQGDPPIPLAEIVRSSANMHMVPPTPRWRPTSRG